MAGKRTIHEICQTCGKIAALQESDGTVYMNGHDCTGVHLGPLDYPRSFRPGQVLFVPRYKPLTDDELKELEQWGTRPLYSSTPSLAKARRIVSTIKTLQDKNKRLSSDFREMTSDCAKLQKILSDIGFKVRDALGIDIVQQTITPCTGMWKCKCDIWNYPSQKKCVNCGIKNL